jgi:hypothetical protein
MGHPCVRGEYVPPAPSPNTIPLSNPFDYSSVGNWADLSLGDERGGTVSSYHCEKTRVLLQHNEVFATQLSQQLTCSQLSQGEDFFNQQLQSRFHELAKLRGNSLEGHQLLDRCLDDVRAQLSSLVLASNKGTSTGGELHFPNTGTTTKQVEKRKLSKGETRSSSGRKKKNRVNTNNKNIH